MHIDQSKRPAAFFDRDGVLNIDRGYTHKSDHLEWIAGTPDAVRLLNESQLYRDRHRQPVPRRPRLLRGSSGTPMDD